ncbi:MAG: ATP-binding protein [Candidatus Omnitrophota bacterium]|nr:MAG: ATP-binding protein [Candidatus Omnitrophota bacterium]
MENLCRKLKPIIGSKADELWYMWLASDFQERRDLEIEIQMIAEKILKKGPLQDKEILLPPPSEEQAEGAFLLGNVIYRDKKLFPFHLKEEDFIKQIGIFSITGGGKTNLGLLLALQLLRKKIPFIVIDWKRQWRSILSLKDFPELKEVQVYTIGRDVLPFFWNPFRPPTNIDYKTWISVVIECLEKSHLAGLGVADFIIRIYEKLFKETKSDNFYPNFYDGLNELGKIKASAREFLWWQSTKRIFKSFTFGPGSKSFNARNPIKLEELLEKPVIFELDQEMPKPLRIFFTEIILRFIHLYRLSQGDSDKLRHVLFLEEIHNLFQKTKYEKDKIDSLENVYREIRSTGQGLVSITQHCSLLPVYILGNSHTLIFLPLQHQADIEAARKATFLPREEEEYFNMLKTGQAIVKIMERINPCLIKIPLVPFEKGVITDGWLKVNRQGYLPRLHNDKTAQEPGYLPRDNMEGEKSKYPHNEANTHLSRLLVDVFLNPLSGITQRYKRLSFNAKYGNQFKNLLVSQGLIQPRNIVTKSGWITLFELTQKGRATLRDLGYAARDEREGIVHKFWKHKIAKYYKDKDYSVLVEEHVNGKPDVIVMARGMKMAVEIETGSSDFAQNIEKDLKAGFDGIICIAVSRQVEEKIKQDLREKNLADRIKITSVFSFEL